MICVSVCLGAERLSASHSWNIGCAQDGLSRRHSARWEIPSRIFITSIQVHIMFSTFWFLSYGIQFLIRIERTLKLPVKICKETQSQDGIDGRPTRCEPWLSRAPYLVEQRLNAVQQNKQTPSLGQIATSLVWWSELPHEWQQACDPYSRELQHLYKLSLFWRNANLVRGWGYDQSFSLWCCRVISTTTDECSVPEPGAQYCAILWYFEQFLLA